MSALDCSPTFELILNRSTTMSIRLSRIDSYGSYSGSGYSSCCPQVVDPKTFLALISFMAAAVYLLQTVIDMSALGGRRKKRSVLNVFLQGKKKCRNVVIFCANFYDQF